LGQERLSGVLCRRDSAATAEQRRRAARDYAAEHDTTLTDLLGAFFQSVQRVNAIRTDTPVLLKLAGSRRLDKTVGDYYQHLERKYFDRHQPDSQ
jgi:hypothetical protein